VIRESERKYSDQRFDSREFNFSGSLDSLNHRPIIKKGPSGDNDDDDDGNDDGRREQLNHTF